MGVPEVNTVAKVDWGYSVPTQEGKFNGDSFNNLEVIAHSRLLRSDPEIQKKCWRFATLQIDGKSTYKAGHILAKNHINASQEKVTFKDGTKEIDKYKLAALKKDYPEFSASKLKNVTYNHFEDLIDFLYEEPRPKEVEDNIFRTMESIGLDTSLLKMIYRNKFPEGRSLENIIKNCPSRHLPRLLESLILYAKNNKTTLKISDRRKADIRFAFLSIRTRITNFSSTKREDILAAAEIVKVAKKYKLKDQDEIQNSFILENAKNEFDKAIKSDSPRSFFSGLLQKLAEFLSVSLLNWFDSDREFILNLIKSVPNIEITINKDIPQAMMDELAKMDNLDKITVGVSVSDACKQLMRNKGLEIEELEPIR